MSRRATVLFLAALTLAHLSTSGAVTHLPHGASLPYRANTWEEEFVPLVVDERSQPPAHVPRGAPTCGPVVLLEGGCSEWVAASPEGTFNEHVMAAVGSPDGARAYTVAVGGAGFLVTAYLTSDGTQIWRRAHTPPGYGFTVPYDVEVSPDGRTLFVVSWSFPSAGGATHFVTVALDAESGQPRWWSAFAGEGGGTQPWSLGLSPGGSTVVSGGAIAAAAGGWAFALVAHDAATGEERWSRTWGGAAGTLATQYGDIAFSSDGLTVFATGASYGPGSSGRTVALDTASGADRWTHLGAAGAGVDLSYAPTTGVLYVVTSEARVIAHDGASGAVLWTDTFGDDLDGARGGGVIESSADGSLVAAAGTVGSGNGEDVVVALFGALGPRLAQERISGPAGARDVPDDLAFWNGRLLLATTFDVLLKAHPQWCPERPCILTGGDGAVLSLSPLLDETGRVIHDGGPGWWDEARALVPRGPAEPLLVGSARRPAGDFSSDLTHAWVVAPRLAPSTSVP